MQLETATLRVAWESHKDQQYNMEALIRQIIGVYDVRRNDIEGTVIVSFDPSRARLEDIVAWVGRFGHILRLPGYDDFY